MIENVGLKCLLRFLDDVTFFWLNCQIVRKFSCRVFVTFKFTLCVSQQFTLQVVRFEYCSDHEHYCLQVLVVCELGGVC